LPQRRPALSTIRLLSRATRAPLAPDQVAASSRSAAQWPLWTAKKPRGWRRDRRPHSQARPWQLDESDMEFTLELRTSSSKPPIALSAIRGCRRSKTAAETTQPNDPETSRPNTVAHRSWWPLVSLSRIR
jgi:hypothetical protein